MCKCINVEGKLARNTAALIDLMTSKIINSGMKIKSIEILGYKENGEYSGENPQPLIRVTSETNKE